MQQVCRQEQGEDQRTTQSMLRQATTKPTRENHTVQFCLAAMYLLNQISNIKFRFKGESLWLSVQRINEDTVIGRVANHPANPGLLLKQLIGVPVKDVLDVWINSHTLQ